MAGGMNKRGSGFPLSDRVRAGSGQSHPPASVDDACPTRHCWVAGAVDGLDVKRPGLLFEWRRTPYGWEGRVMYAALLRPGVWLGVEEWLPASQLTPI
ncbi:hypothetical protein [Nocardioides sp.]|uniref:hypothetical protein n=1 Tax=Nocardioides sp. TaxID=35761 RepID=UPI0031FF0167|nr:hypothetical protein [Nocardioides sp.]